VQLETRSLAGRSGVTEPPSARCNTDWNIPAEIRGNQQIDGLERPARRHPTRGREYRRLVRPVAFVDLNGTLAHALRGGAGFLSPIGGAFDAVRLLTKAGYACPVITVQGRIGAGVLTEQRFRAAFAVFERQAAEHGAQLDGLYLCPHAAAQGCPCRKPQTALYEQAARDLDADLSRSWVIGDTGLDLGAASNLGVRAVLVRTGHGHAAQHDPIPRDAVADHVLAAARHILGSADRHLQSHAVGEVTSETRSA
jgi:D-glycero-D-manno-heptose 1,7-bisphosphate phosphatase